MVSLTVCYGAMCIGGNRSIVMGQIKGIFCAITHIEKLLLYEVIDGILPQAFSCEPLKIAQED